jgi:hypothetical protein
MREQHGAAARETGLAPPPHEHRRQRRVHEAAHAVEHHDCARERERHAVHAMQVSRDECQRAEQQDAFHENGEQHDTRPCDAEHGREALQEVAGASLRGRFALRAQTAT